MSANAMGSRPMPRAEHTPHHVLPGRFRIERGTFADYRSLEHFHYAPGRPAAPAGVWRGVDEEVGSGECGVEHEEVGRGESGEGREEEVARRGDRIVAA